MITSLLQKSGKYIALFFSVLVLHSFAQKTPQQVIILHTNDMHARIDNMAKLAYFKDSLLKTNPLVFLVAAGDNFTGNPVVDMVEDKGYPMIDIMNRCGFNLTCFGNHEFDLGQDFLNKRIAQATFPFICCNIDASGGVVKQPKPWVILNSGDSIKLAFLGIIQRGQNGLPDSHPLRLTGLKFVDGIEKAKEYVNLKTQYNNLIALTHLGVEDDLKLAEAIPQIDIIIGGHSHTLIDTAKFVKNVMVLQAGSHVKWIGKTTLTMQHGKILNKKDEVIPISAIKSERKDIRELIDKYNDNQELKKVVGIAATAIKGPAELGSLMTDALRDHFKANLAFINRGGIRIDSLAAGEIKMKDVYKLDPFGNQSVTVQLSLDEIKTLIRNAYNMNKRLDLEVSGVSYRILTDVEGNCVNVLMLTESMSELKPGNYLIAMNSYIASAYNFQHTNDIETHEETTAQILMEYLQKVKTVNYQGVNRISESKYH